MYSLNVPVPTAVADQRDELEPRLEPFSTVRDSLTLVVKRFGDRSPEAMEALQRRIAGLLAKWPPVEARISHIDAFESPAGGPAPVVYLAVESPGLEALHTDLVDRFGTADPQIEGHNYVPHVTLARGGPMAALADITGPLDVPIEWSIESLELWSVQYSQPVTEFTLPSEGVA